MEKLILTEYSLDKNPYFTQPIDILINDINLMKKYLIDEDEFDKYLIFLLK